jgi:hypothetical protein
MVAVTAAATELAQVTRFAGTNGMVTSDGKRFLYVSDAGLVTADLDSLLRGDTPPAGLRTLVLHTALQDAGVAVYFAAGLRPDGTVLGVRPGPGAGELSLVRIEPPGTEKILVTERPPAPGQSAPTILTPSQTYDGAWIAYQVGDSGFGYARGDGSDQALVAIGGLQGVSISPDGTRVAYARRLDDNYTHVAVRGIGTDSETFVRGSEQAQAGLFNETMPVWSSDGRYVAYTSDFGVAPSTSGLIGQNLWVFDTTSGTNTRLTTSNALVRDIRWGTDGYIYFDSDSGTDYSSGTGAVFHVWRLRPAL